MIDSGLVRLNGFRFRESRRCARETYPESYVTEYILIYEDKPTRSLSATCITRTESQSWSQTGRSRTASVGDQPRQLTNREAFCTRRTQPQANFVPQKAISVTCIERTESQSFCWRATAPTEAFCTTTDTNPRELRTMRRHGPLN